MIRTVEEVTGKTVPYVVRPAPRVAIPQPGRLAVRKLRDRLGWSPQYPTCATIVTHAWNFANRVA